LPTINLPFCILNLYLYTATSYGLLTTNLCHLHIELFTRTSKQTTNLAVTGFPNCLHFMVWSTPKNSYDRCL